MAGTIPSKLFQRARNELSREVFARLQESPKERLPVDMWHGLNEEQRRLVTLVRQQSTDGYAGNVDRGHNERRMNGAQAHAAAYAGRDPLGPGVTDGQAPPARANDNVQVQELPRPHPDPKTGLDPAAMQQIFGHLVDTTDLEKFEGQELMNELRKRFFAKHVVLGYGAAREVMFKYVDNHDGKVKSVYSEKTIGKVNGIPEANGPNGFNAEHTWPQSQLKKAHHPDAVSDLHHIFPADTEANGKRGSYPFGVVKTVTWQEPPRRDANGNALEGSKLGYDEKNQIVFEPRPEHRGDVARALFWISTAYNMAMPDDEEAVLRQWDKDDPVDAAELERDEYIGEYQHDENPFVEVKGLADHIKNF